MHLGKSRTGASFSGHGRKPWPTKARGPYTTNILLSLICARPLDRRHFGGLFEGHHSLGFRVFLEGIFSPLPEAPPGACRRRFPGSAFTGPQSTGIRHGRGRAESMGNQKRGPMLRGIVEVCPTCARPLFARSVPARRGMRITNT